MKYSTYFELQLALNYSTYKVRLSKDRLGIRLRLYIKAVATAHTLEPQHIL